MAIGRGPAVPRTRDGHARRLHALAARLRRLRREHRLTVREAAARIGVGPPVVRRIEAGAGNPSLAILVSVARAFGVSLAYLLGKRGKRE